MRYAASPLKYKSKLRSAGARGGGAEDVLERLKGEVGKWPATPPKPYTSPSREESARMRAASEAEGEARKARVGKRMGEIGSAIGSAASKVGSAVKGTLDRVGDAETAVHRTSRFARPQRGKRS